MCEREKPAAIVYDEEFTELIDKSGIDLPKVIAWHDGEAGDVPTVEELIEKGSTDKLPVPEHTTRPVILTSGTTGTPKGAPRGESGLDGAVALLSKMPFSAGGTTYIVAPLFHTWGWAHLNMAMLLGSKMVLRRKFDPKDCLETIQEHDCDALIVIPVMMQRIMKLSEERALGRLVQRSASSPRRDRRCRATWRPSGWTRSATTSTTPTARPRSRGPRSPSPGTCVRPPGRPARRRTTPWSGSTTRTATRSRTVSPVGSSSGNTMLFGGYTGDEDEGKEMIDGLMSSGDIGRLDEDGRLFVEGRDDEMIVSGGENVFPKEIEDCLARHESVSDVAAIGVDDDEYGKRLRAFVVKDGDVDEDTLKKHVKDNLARYKVPREIVFLDELPRNATGKVLKKDLKDYDEDGNPGDTDSSDSDGDS